MVVPAFTGAFSSATASGSPSTVRVTDHVPSDVLVVTAQ